MLVTTEKTQNANARVDTSFNTSVDSAVNSSTDTCDNAASRNAY